MSAHLRKLKRGLSKQFDGMGVWKRKRDHSHDQLTPGIYAFIVSAVTAAGILVTFLFVGLSSYWEPSPWGTMLLCVLMIVGGMFGSLIAILSPKPGTSFTGFMIVAVSFGLPLGPLLAMYTDADIAHILGATLLVVIALGTIGALVPKSLGGIGSLLISSITILLVAYLAVPVSNLLGYAYPIPFSVLDWVGIILFSVLVIVDWNRAMRLAYTLDNAVDSAVAIYLDWFNIFIRLLSLNGQRKN